jgi:hypothetical protein
VAAFLPNLEKVNPKQIIDDATLWSRATGSSPHVVIGCKRGALPEDRLSDVKGYVDYVPISFESWVDTSSGQMGEAFRGILKRSIGTHSVIYDDTAPMSEAIYRSLMAPVILKQGVGAACFAHGEQHRWLTLPMAISMECILAVSSDVLYTKPLDIGLIVLSMSIRDKGFKIEYLQR